MGDPVANEEFQYNNEAEEDMAQLHAIHIHMNAVRDVQRALEAQAAQESATECVACGDQIPEQRRISIPGVQRCTHCQTVHERRAAGY
jgi:RNA polymerase-binding transcription factor DksA